MSRKSGDSSGRDPKTGQFLAGNSGKPKGARHASTVAAQTLLDGEAQTLTRKAVDMALSGVISALRLCLERILPPRKERSLDTTLPALDGVQDVPRVIAALLGGVGDGEFTPGEGESLGRMVLAYTKGVEAAELDERITLLEERIK
jgi:hypothetical protein